MKTASPLYPSLKRYEAESALGVCGDGSRLSEYLDHGAEYPKIHVYYTSPSCTGYVLLPIDCSADLDD